MCVFSVSLPPHLTEVNAHLCCRFLREIYSYVRATVKQYFPGMENPVIGNLLFLRWICPAIVCPEKYGLLNGMSTVDCRNSSLSR
jgi:GTPase-activator protein for Ras-like GTPase